MSLTILSSKTLLSSLDHFKQLVIEYDELLNENIGLKEKLKETEEVNKSFMSVSLIVNTKNENEKLKNELFLLKKRIVFLEKELKAKSSANQIPFVTFESNKSINIQKQTDTLDYSTQDKETLENVITINQQEKKELEEEKEELKKEDEELKKEDEEFEEEEEEEEEFEEEEEEEEELEEEEEKEKEELKKEDEELEKEDEEEEEVGEDEEEEEEEEDEDDEIELYEEEYDGKIYFISDDHHKHIYDRLKTETGDYEPSDDPIGYLKVENGKEEIIWN